MEGWNDFFMLAGATAGVLIGLIFVVITLGADHRIGGDEARTRLFITPILVNFTSVLIVALLTVAPISAPLRAVSLGIVGCAGLGYVMNLALTSRRRTDTESLDLSWHVLFPIAAYALWRRLRPRGRFRPRSPIRSARQLPFCSSSPRSAIVGW